ncbi:peptidylprolyl isomerase [Gorillibacterium massiliense]|uniref:peptidylprolyl isomerase n=1 Tax=Gorillibacterium massiliense TaxID=1280390 RepID=UPI00138E189F|nr:peptidylprolyl isomerase [Gorillibacterium massiliense]
MRNVKLLWGTIVLLVAICLVLARMANLRADRVLPPAVEDERAAVVAVIGDKEINAGALQDKVYQKYSQQQLNQMLDRKALELEAAARSIQVGDDEINKELTTMMEGYNSEDEFYSAMLEQVGMSRDELREDVFYKLLSEKLVTADIVVSDAEIDDYFTAHPEEFGDTVQLRLQQIINETLEQADRTYELAQQGGDFSVLAKERSLDVNTANDGGDLGWVDENDPFVPMPIMKAAQTMEIGEISKPLKIDAGYAVIRLSDRKTVNKGSQQELREKVRQQLALQKATPINEYIDSLRIKYNARILAPETNTTPSPSQ